MGCTHIEEIPWDLADAIAQANRILDWLENCLPDEVPPEWMWPFADEINDWFEQIKAAKETKASGDEVAPMTRNEDPRLEKARALLGRR